MNHVILLTISIKNGDYDAVIKHYLDNNEIPESCLIRTLSGSLELLEKLMDNGYTISNNICRELVINANLENLFGILAHTKMTNERRSVFMDWALRVGDANIVIHLYTKYNIRIAIRQAVALLMMQDTNILRKLILAGYRIPPIVKSLTQSTMTTRSINLIANVELHIILSSKYYKFHNLVNFLTKSSTLVLDDFLVPEIYITEIRYQFIKASIISHSVGILQQLFARFGTPDDCKILISQFVVHDYDDLIWILDTLFKITKNNILESTAISFVPHKTTTYIDNVIICANKKMCQNANNTMTLECDDFDKLFESELYLYRDSSNYILEVGELLKFWTIGLNCYNHLIIPNSPMHPYTNEPISPVELYRVANLCRMYNIKLPTILTAFLLNPTMVINVYILFKKQGKIYSTYDVFRKMLVDADFRYKGGDPENNEEGEWVLNSDGLSEEAIALYKEGVIGHSMLLVCLGRVSYCDE